MLIATCVLVVALCLVVRFYWNRRNLYIFSSKLSGPLALPFIGNGLLFACKSEDIFDVIISVFIKYKHPMRFWLGPKLVAIFSDIKHVEKILSSSKLTYKSYIYKFLGEFGGDGLVTCSGPTWKKYRKVIQPLVNLKFTLDKIPVMQKHLDRLLLKMDGLVGQKVDVHHFIRLCSFDTMSEVIFGKDVRTQEGNYPDVAQAFEDMYDNAFTQMVKPWLHINFIFNLTQYKSERDRLMKIFHKFGLELIEESKNRISDDSIIEEFPSILDQILKCLQETPVMDTKALLDNILTLYAASEDTLGIVAYAALITFGMYPEYQEKAYQEISSVLPQNGNEITPETLNQLNYLDMCIKDILRLFPIAPFILRKCTEDFKVGEYTIPIGCEVLVPIYLVNRDQNSWSNGSEFYPEHFLPEEVKKRHVGAYLPFSMGPRACIGKYLAHVAFKVMMINILRRYRIEAEGKLSDINFKTDISLRIKNGYKITLHRRL